MNKKTVILLSIIVLLIFFGFIILLSNKTFYKTTYIGVNGEDIFIPRYSYFKKECCMTVAVFYSLRSINSLQQEIDDYMKDFEYFDDETTYGYKNGDLFIQNYEVFDIGLYRKIVIVY